MGQMCAGLGAPRMKSKHLLLKEGGRSPHDPMECQWGQQNASFLWELVFRVLQRYYRISPPTQGKFLEMHE